MEPVRCFFCLPLPDALAADMAAWIQSARKIMPRARWVSRGSLHVTLRFCGEIPQQTVQRLASEAEGELVRELTPPVSLRIAGTGTFGRPPRVLWAGLEGETDRLSRLNRLLERLCRSAGLDPECRGFAPHLTLARFPAPPAKTPLPAWNLSGRLWQADRVIFMRSRLTPAGPRYSPIKIYGAD